MRILWFSPTASMWANNNVYNGGGWISSLQYYLQKESQTQLAIAFLWDKDFCEVKDGVTYYGIEYKSLKESLLTCSFRKNDPLLRMQEIIKDFSPEIIQIFGTENLFGRIVSKTDIPVVIHLQGFLCALYESWLPQGMSWCMYKKYNVKRYYTAYLLKREIQREIDILLNCRNFFGRTHWDYSVSKLLSPDSKYFICEEILRPVIYNSPNSWKPLPSSSKRIISLISSPSYKGGDVILRTARLLKKYSDIKFEWFVYGVNELKEMSKLTGLVPEEVGVFPQGVISAEELIDVVMSSNVYFHPSYIENSSNSICEMQLLGIPVIATNVGGVSSLISHREDGILVAANDIYETAFAIKELLIDEQLSVQLGEHGRQRALERHNPVKIAETVIQSYTEIINNAQ